MATYKVIQDIEAEDHILGPLSLRQFIFGLGAALCFYLTYLLISKHAAFLTPIFLLPGLFALFFAIPFGRDQPTEVWALAKIRYFLKPRRRIWDQSGVKELVTVTAPKKVEERRTDGLTQNEVTSRLSVLANTIDSRGWAIKNVNVNLYTQPQQLIDADSDRLVNMSSVPQAVPDYDAVQAADDIMDAQNNPIAQQFQQLINSSEQTHRQKLQDMMAGRGDVAAAPEPVASPSPKPDYWFLNEPVAPPKIPKDMAMFAPQVLMPASDPATSTPSTATPTPLPTEDETALAARLKQQKELDKSKAAFGNMKTILPLDKQHPVPPAAPAQPPKPNPAVQKLASNNDLNIDTIAREAKRTNDSTKQLGDDEVVISLH